VVLTGGDEGRLAGLSEAVFRQQVDLVVLPGSLRGRAGRALIESIDKSNIPTVAAAQGQHILLGDNVWLEILWTSPSSPEDGGSLVARLVAGNVVLLLLGDAPRGVQAELVEAGLQPADVLMVPRHGAAGALDATLLQVARPRIAVLSAGADNRFGFPSESTLEMLKEVTVLRTDRHGTIELIIGRDGYELFTDR